jgi:uncharacterized DUF497 family protein
MDFEWDESKRRANIEKHGYDFTQAELVLGHAHALAASRHAVPEVRWLAIGEIDGKLIAVVFTMRGDVYRIISLRRAARAERRIYEALYE